MQDFNRPNRKNRSLSIKDYHWGKVEGPVKIGIWAAQAAIEPGKKVELRAAVRNLSIHPVELTNDFRLTVKHGEEVHEYFGGPRSSMPVFLEAGEFQEILAWRLDEESGLNVGINEYWAIYRPKGGEEVISQVMTIEIYPDAGE